MNMPGFRCHAIATVLALVLGACAAPSQQAGNNDTAPQAEASAPQTPVVKPAKPPRMSDPLPPQRVQGGTVVIDTTCRTDADCAVKDVGNCCGYYPACVNKDSPTDPEGVRAQCAKSGMASVCGFREISACSCNAGKCESADGGAQPVAQ
jgi:hypothetical protein